MLFLTKHFFKMAKILKRDGNKLVIEIEMDLFGDMLSQEEAIQEALNEAGKLATVVAFSNFEEKSSHLEVDGVRLSSKG